MTGQERLDRHLDPGAAGSPVRLLPGLAGNPGHVHLIAGEACAASARGQLLTWAVVNLLLRCYGVLDAVTVTCPDALLTTRLPRITSRAAPSSLHQALRQVAEATADPAGHGPRLVISADGADDKAGTATLLLGTPDPGVLESIGQRGPAWGVTAGAWKLAIASPSFLRARREARLPSLDEPGPVCAAVWLAAALACGEVFKHAGRIREGRGRLIEAFSVNLWTLTGSDGLSELDGPDGPANPPRLPAHHVVGAGAVGEAYLAVLATSEVATAVALLDDDVLGDSNLNRHILAGWADLDAPKTALASERLAGYPAQIFPVLARWDRYLSVPPAERPARPAALIAGEAAGRYDLVISAVDRNDSRISIAAVHPTVILGGSTLGLQVETGRYRDVGPWQCLACGSPAEPLPSIEQAAAELADMVPAELEAAARERGLDPAALRSYLARPQCGTLGEREVARFAAFTRPDWSVSFVSAASGALLAARALTHATRDDTPQALAQGDTVRLWLANPAMGRTAHRRDPLCPICGPAASAVPA
jgi:hypothetical protein